MELGKLQPTNDIVMQNLNLLRIRYFNARVDQSLSLMGARVRHRSLGKYSGARARVPRPPLCFVGCSCSSSAIQFSFYQSMFLFILLLLSFGGAST